MKKIFKKLSFLKVHACAYIFPKNGKQDYIQMRYALKIFTKHNKSGIKKIDAQLNSNSECFAVFDNDTLVHMSWVFKKKHLTSQLGFRDAYTVGNSYTIPSYRGKGVYRDVLKFICSKKDKDMLIFVSPNNLSSKRSIENAGFEKLYEFQLLRFLGFKIRLKKNEDRNNVIHKI